MTFTYDLSAVDENLLNISRVRLELGDTQENVGVRPDGSNLQDEEILLWLDEETNDITRVVARAAASLANMWTTVASITVGPRREELGNIAKGWADRAGSLAPYGLNYVARIRRVNPIHDPYHIYPGDEPGL